MHEPHQRITIYCAKALEIAQRGPGDPDNLDHFIEIETGQL